MSINFFIIFFLTFLQNIYSWKLYPFIKYKYLQGIYFNQGNLYYGTNNGFVHCVTKNDDEKSPNYVDLWKTQLGKRNIKKINNGNHNHLIIESDSHDGKYNGHSYIVNKQNGHCIWKKDWSDSTIYECITDDNCYCRFNKKGEIFTFPIEKKSQNAIKKKIRIAKTEYIVSIHYYENEFYIMTNKGRLLIITRNFNIKKIHELNVTFVSCMTLLKNHNNQSLYVYLGDVNGHLNIFQITNDKIISSQHYNMNVHSVLTNIYLNFKTIFTCYANGIILGHDKKNFMPVFNITNENNFYSDIHSIYTSTVNIFICENNYIKLYTIL